MMKQMNLFEIEENTMASVPSIEEPKSQIETTAEEADAPAVFVPTPPVTVTSEPNAVTAVQQPQTTTAPKMVNVTKTVTKQQAKAPKKAAKPKKAKPVLPDACAELTKLVNGGFTFESLIAEISDIMGLQRNNAFSAPRNYCDNFAYVVNKNTVTSFPINAVPEAEDLPLFSPGRWYHYSSTNHECKATLLYFSETGDLWISELTATFDRSFSDTKYNYGGHSTQNWSTCNVKSFVMTPWKHTTRMQKRMTAGFIYLNSRQNMVEILKNTNPYGYIFFENFDPELGLMAPYLEQLAKADYKIADKIIGDWNIGRLEQTDIDAMNRLFNKESSIKKIFKTSKTVYKTLKGETDIKIWDTYRKMDKMGKLTADQVQRCYDCGFREKELDSVNSILNYQYNGKRVFNFDSLLNYLNRLDMYEAIDNQQAFMLLPDYLRMCNTLGMEPRIDGDSLAREHNIAARLCYIKNRKCEPANFAKACKDMAANNYEENVFFVRAIRDYDDLFDEAKQQHNCLAGYGEVISNKRELVYVMREKANPDKSLITVSLNPQETQIRQKFMSYNRPIHNKAQSEFLERWLKMVKAKNARGFASVAELQNNLTQTLA